ncbi:hypothetical protein DEAC_c02690 [Desulfosporosinus acididurans]|uniref:Uncharacterized protein n=1 Tax=Desulfosporosinus acididurans TaxID=476652 RepID=A0A0J1FX18_9FIRM|nr:hypothetical protein DEAC_c02690 [Desulfosporosinus acididurans]
MIFASFIVYVIVFSLLLSFPSFRNKKRSSSIVKLLVIPIFLGALVVILKIIKVYFVYKFLIILFISVLILLSYWQWGGQFRRWWR